MKTFLTIIVFLAVVAAAGAVFVWFGFYDISARVRHWGITAEFLEALRDRSIIAHSRNITIPAPGDPAKGASLYEACTHCHGAPGVPAHAFSQGLYPAPADLLSGEIQKEWNGRQLYWIVYNGIKFTGMPSFAPTYRKAEIADVVAFVQRLPGISPSEYKKMSGAGPSQH